MVGGEAAATQNPGRSSSASSSRFAGFEFDPGGAEEEVTPLNSSSAIPWPKVSVVIPGLNEARNLPHVFSLLPPALHEVIIVNGHSEDDTIAVARRLRPDVRIITQSRSGKSNALACGFAAATGDIIVMVDADGSADPAEIPQFVTALLGLVDLAKGIRFAAGGGSSDITQLRRLGNWVLSRLGSLLCGTQYSDLCYGYNAFWRRRAGGTAPCYHAKNPWLRYQMPMLGNMLGVRLICQTSAEGHGLWSHALQLLARTFVSAATGTRTCRRARPRSRLPDVLDALWVI